MSQHPVLIIGGGGKTGGRVNALLRSRGMATRPVSRTSAIPFDWTWPKTRRAALDGVSKAYVIYQPDLAVPGAVEAVADLGDMARDQGLEQIVLLSGRGEPGAERAEQALEASGVPSTIVRASWFNQNFSEGYLIEGGLMGHIALPAGEVREPFLDADDIADVVVAALTDARHVGQLYEVTGPRAMTFAEAVDQIAAGVGRPIRYEQISADEFAAGMRGGGVPDDYVALLLELFSIVLDGRNSAVMPGVEQALGRPARDFSDYVRRTVASGAWRV